MNIKPKHRKIAEHFHRFTDKHWYKDVILTDEHIQIFIELESIGYKNLSKEKLDKIQFLLDGKENEGIQLKMVYEDIFYYWSMGFGSHIPIVECILDELKEIVLLDNYNEKIINEWLVSSDSTNKKYIEPIKKDKFLGIEMKGNYIYLVSLLKIYKSLLENDALYLLQNYTGFDLERKNKILELRDKCFFV